MGNFKEDIAAVRAFVFDVDGVFTDGGIMPVPGDDFIRKYNAKDGYAIAYAIKAGYLVAIMTGGRGEMLKKRFEMLRVTKFVSNCAEKLKALEEFMVENSLSPEQVVFMGDDIPDYEAMQAVGIAVCPSDAVPEIVEISQYVSQFEGGKGCVRDIVEQVLRARGDWMKNTNGMNTIPSI